MKKAVKRVKIKIDGKSREALADGQNQLVLNDKTISLDSLNLTVMTDQPVICVALNYNEHYAQVVNEFDHPPYGGPPGQPVFFIKPVNILTTHSADVQCPQGVDNIYTGAGLGVVIGRRASRVRAEEAMDYIEGYTLFNDFTLKEDSYLRPPVKTKCFDSFGPLGPYMVYKEALGDLHDLSTRDLSTGDFSIRTLVNGEVKQAASTADMKMKIPDILQALTGFMTLEPGAVVVTGFPAGRVAVKPGDEVIVDIEPVGSLTNYIVTEAEYYDGIP